MDPYPALLALTMDHTSSPPGCHHEARPSLLPGSLRWSFSLEMQRGGSPQCQCWTHSVLTASRPACACSSRAESPPPQLPISPGRCPSRQRSFTKQPACAHTLSFIDPCQGSWSHYFQSYSVPWGSFLSSSGHLKRSSPSVWLVLCENYSICRCNF